ncbi:MAG: DUF1573 domain-containing protein [Cyclobacteriaceae bacterium]|nr:DUF1573 domain-containing protein [Cyclobacteriaceae bacterium]
MQKGKNPMVYRRLFVFLFLVLLSAHFLYAQQAKIHFPETTYEFGSLKEEMGTVDYNFSFVNTGDAPLVIQSVSASCGCTTPGWTKEPVMPGDSGFIAVRYNPYNRPGAFRKSLSVNSNAQTAAVQLFITGTVMPRPKNAADRFPIKIGQLRTPYRSFNFGKITTEKPFTKYFDVLNDGNTPLKFVDKAAHAKYISIRYEPMELKPGESGHIVVTYDAKQRNDLGFVTDNITIYTNEETQFEKHYRLVATIEDYFPPMTPEELAQAPKLRLAKKEHDFGSMKEGQKAEVQIMLINEGKSELELRKILSNCNCVKTDVQKQSLKAGESIPMILTFDTSGRKGPQTKSVTFFSNDPGNAIQQFTVKARIND